MDRAGLSTQDGPTHHGLFDIAYLRHVPNCTLMAPKDEDELVDMMFTATQERHPTFIRYPRGPAEGVPVKDQPRLLEVGKAEIWFYISMFFPPLVPCFHALFEQIRLLWICHVVHLLVVAAIIDAW